MAKFTDEELEMLTEDERRVIEEIGDEYDDDNEDPPMDPDDDDNERDTGDGDPDGDDPDSAGEGEDGEDEAAAGDDSGKTGDEEADPEKADKPDAEQEEAPEETTQPPLNVEYPEDYENKLKGFEDQRTKLDVDFDDGELTSQEYRQQLREIENQEQEIRDQVLKAQIAQEMQENQQRQAWQNTVNDFLDSNDVYRQSRALYRELNDTVIEIANSQEAEGMTGRKILEEAHKRVSSDPALASVFKAKGAETEGEEAEEGKEGAKEKEGKRRVTPRNVPPTLANVPAADTTTADEGSRFGKLDRMDGLELEAELEKLSNTNPAMVEEYLSR